MQHGASSYEDEPIGLSAQIMGFSTTLENSLAVFKQWMRANQRQFASEFNCIELFVRPNENRLTDMLGYFLDPRQTHGQGWAFLDAFLEHLGRIAKVGGVTVPRFASGSPGVEVVREKRTDENRRIDLTVKVPLAGGQFHWIGLENKAYERTSEQPEQVEHYSKFLNRVSNGEAWLVYLTPNGSKPTERSISKEQIAQLGGRLVLASYAGDIVPLVEKFQVACEAENVRRFLKEFAAFLRKNYLGEDAMTDQKIIEGVVKSTPAIITHYAQIGSAIERLRRTCYDKVANRLSGEFMIGEEDLSVLKTVSKGSFSIGETDVGGKTRDNADWEGLKLTIYFELGSFMMIGAQGKQACAPGVADKLHQYLLECRQEEPCFQVDRDNGAWHAGTWHFFSPEIFAKLFAPVLPHDRLVEEKVKMVVQSVKQRMQGLIEIWEKTRDRQG